MKPTWSLKMITLCTVLTPIHNNYLDIFLESLVKNTKTISKILIADTTTYRPREFFINLLKENKEQELYNTTKKWKINNIEVERFEAPIHENEFGHALGLHACIDKTETEYIFFSDPDLFFYTAVDELYLNLKTKYNLEYIGCSHHSALANAYGFFPYLVSSLVKKKDLPPKDFLKEHLYFKYGIIIAEQEQKDIKDVAPGKYLIGGPILEIKDELPNPKKSVLYDTGVNLCLWGIRNNWKWLSFQTLDCHLYTTKYYRTGNLKINERLPYQKLIWHSVREDIKIMKQAYNEVDETND